MEQTIEVCAMVLLRTLFPNNTTSWAQWGSCDPAGLLSLLLPSSAIKEANVAVANIRQQRVQNQRVPYLQLSDENSTKIDSE